MNSSIKPFVLVKNPIMPSQPVVEKLPPENRPRGASPRNGVVPPVAHRFQPGVSGNPGGRRRVVTEAYNRMLSQKIKVKVRDPEDPDGKKKIVTEMTRIEVIALKLAECAASDHRNNVAAAKELRAVVEPNEEKGAGGGGGLTIPQEVIKMVYNSAQNAAKVYDECGQLLP